MEQTKTKQKTMRNNKHQTLKYTFTKPSPFPTSSNSFFLFYEYHLMMKVMNKMHKHVQNYTLWDFTVHTLMVFIVHGGQ